MFLYIHLHYNNQLKQNKMATTVKYHETSPTKASGANIKKILLAVIEQNNAELFGRRLKANRTNVMVTPLGENLYEVKVYNLVKHTWTPYEKVWEYIFEVKTK